jgi:hypothetical protein
MRILYAGLAVTLIALGGCTNRQIDAFWGHSETRNGNLDTECLHQGPQDTGFVTNCGRHNDEREHNEREKIE